MSHTWWHWQSAPSDNNAAYRRGNAQKDPNKSGLTRITDDFQMDLGIKKPDEDYYARLDDRSRRSQQAMKEIMERNDERDSESRKSILTEEEEEEEEKEEEEEETETNDTEKTIVKDLELEAVDDTDESKEATGDTNEAYSDVAEQSTDTFGAGGGVADVIQADSSFIDPDLKAAQEKIAELEAKLAGDVVQADNSGDALEQVAVESQDLNTSTILGGKQEAAAASPTSTGPAEDKAIEMYNKGRRSTILTTPGGLLSDDEEDEEDGKLRRKRRMIV